MAAPTYSSRTKFFVATVAAAFTLGALYDLIWLPLYEPVWQPAYEFFAGSLPRYRDPIEEFRYEVPYCADSELLGDTDIKEEELRRIFREHEVWLKQKSKQIPLVRGKRAILCFVDLRRHASLFLEYDLRKAILVGVNLRGAELFESGATGRTKKARLAETDLGLANLRHANLARAVLTGTNLTKADLSGANLERAKLDGKAELREADFSGANLKRANLRDGHLDYANFSNADLRRAEGRGSNFFVANFTNACLYRTDLSNTRLKYAKFRGAVLWETKLKGARLSRARLGGAVFEPETLPDAKSLADAEGLGQLRSAARRIGGLAALRAELVSSGLRTPEREVAFALERERTRFLQSSDHGAKVAHKTYADGKVEGCGVPNFGPGGQNSWGSWLEGALRYTFLELPFGYGLFYGRPLALLWLTICFFAFVYYAAVRRDPPQFESALVMEHGPERVLKVTNLGKSDPKRRLTYSQVYRLDYVVYKDRRWDALIFSIYFSIVSTLHFGVQWLDFGKWVARLQTESYSVFGLGSLRFCSGLQSILGLVFLTLFILSYFGRPLH